jgi:hypothetical protein
MKSPEKKEDDSERCCRVMKINAPKFGVEGGRAHARFGVGWVEAIEGVLALLDEDLKREVLRAQGAGLRGGL